MSELNKNNAKSPLVKSVTALDAYFDELRRLGEKISGMDLKSETDFEQAQRLMERFAQCGEGVASEVLTLSRHLNEAQNSTEKIAKEVSARAELLKTAMKNNKKKPKSSDISVKRSMS